MSSRTNDALAEARRIAGENGFVIAEAADCINPSSILDKQYVRVFILYRNRVRLGKRRNPAALLRLIRENLSVKATLP